MPEEKSQDCENNHLARWWQLKDFLFSPLPGEMIQFDEHIFQLGWNHQLVKHELCNLLAVIMGNNRVLMNDFFSNQRRWMPCSFYFFQVSAEDFAVSRMSEDLGGPPRWKNRLNTKKSLSKSLLEPFWILKNHRVADMCGFLDSILGRYYWNHFSCCRRLVYQLAWERRCGMRKLGEKLWTLYLYRFGTFPM